MSLFGRRDPQPNLTHLREALEQHLGLHLATPSADIIAIIEAVAPRDLVQFDNLQSIPGLQELLHVHGLEALVEPNSNTVAIFPRASIAPAANAATAEPRRVLQLRPRAPTAQIIKPADPKPVATATPTPLAPLATPLAVPASLEHLEAFERLLPEIVDLFLKHGRLTTGDKEVLRQIRPTDSSLEARLTALERWQAEMKRRAHGIHLPTVAQHLRVGEDAVVSSEETWSRRFDSVLAWTGKLMKAFEHTGVKFHNRPMWLPH